jgi:hypothetical protein
VRRVDETASKITASAEAADHEPFHTLSEHDGGDRLLEARAVLAVLASSNLRYGKQKIAMLHMYVNWPSFSCLAA